MADLGFLLLEVCRGTTGICHSDPWGFSEPCDGNFFETTKSALLSDVAKEGR